MPDRHGEQPRWLYGLILLGTLFLGSGCNAVVQPAGTSDRAFRETVEHDPFPTAAQAGITK